jgi:ribosomal peptide maturation radical SAM protein 1
MKSSNAEKINRIILISAPWPLFDHPSIQLGALKAWLQFQHPDISTVASHFYLKIAASIGYTVYKEISKRTWLAETVYGALLYPDRFDEIETFFLKEAGRKGMLKGVGFRRITDQVRDVTDEFIIKTDWDQFGLAGFSVCLCQLTASLYMIRKIKDLFPDLTVVVGGSMLAGETISSLLKHFPCIDFAICGEGEKPLARLVRHLRTTSVSGAIAEIPGVASRKNIEQNRPVLFSQLDSLDKLPAPDYKEYFELLSTFSPDKTFFPTLSLELSRGCWWRKTNPSVKRKACAFCNLNLQWEGYRSKSPDRAVTEIDRMTSNHRVLSVRLMDNVLPANEAPKIFRRMNKLNKDFKLFCEVRATTSAQTLSLMRGSGVEEVQIGIESLSSSLLKKMNKGTTAIQNLEIMKHCEEFGIKNVSNLLLRFPGSSKDDVMETLRNLEYAFPFRPLHMVNFWLGLGSEVSGDPSRFEIKSIFNHPNYGKIFPEKVCSEMRFMIQSYRGDQKRQQKLWKPVRKKVRNWEQAYLQLHSHPQSKPILSYRDGGDFLLIRQRRINGEPLIHRLTGTSRAIYLYCRHNRSSNRIINQFQNLTHEKLLPFLRMMMDKKLMFGENNRFLSLAVTAKSRDRS